MNGRRDQSLVSQWLSWQQSREVLDGLSPETGVEGSNGAGQIKARSGGHGKEDVNPCLVHLPGL